MWVVDVETDGELKLGQPRLLFEGPYFTNLWAPNYDVSADGRRFLMLQEIDLPPEPARQIHIVQNWFEELKRRCPAGR